MFERFTERARQVIIFAQDEARSLQSRYIGTEHIVLGLLREEEGLAARVLGGLEVTEEKVHALIARQLEQEKAAEDEVERLPSIVDAGVSQLPFSQSAKKVLELALREALSLGHNYIGTEHVLLGLVRERGCHGTSMLFHMGATDEVVRTEVIRLLSGPGRQQRGESKPEPGPEVQMDMESPFMRGFMEPLLQHLEEMKMTMESLPKTHLTVDDIQQVGTLALAHASTMGLPQEWKQAYADLADASGRLLALAGEAKR